MPAERSFSILVVGAGPAGLAAAWAASRSGGSVGLVDDNPHRGGQIWRGGESRPRDRSAARWFDRLDLSNVEFLSGTRIIAQPQPGVLLAETPDGGCCLRYGRLILAPGARERFLPFPGWTLPNVCGVGGLQALVKGGLPIAGKSVIVAGTGPLLLAVAAALRQKGAMVRLIAEQAPWTNLARFGVALLSEPGKLLQALELKRRLFGVPYRTSCWPSAALGENCVEGVQLTDGRQSWSVPCDYLACAFGLVPNVELPLLLGCKVEEGFVHIDEWQRTAVPEVYCAGEATGIGGVEKALVEGQIAGYAAVGLSDFASKRFGEREQCRRFAERLATAFALRDELLDLPQEATIVCRCEDVTYAQLKPYKDWRVAKLLTRCGMGPCQGRVCGPALAFLRGWEVESIRPPLFPVRLESLLREASDSQTTSE